MTNEQKIDYMIQSLQIAKDEIIYVQNWKSKVNIRSTMGKALDESDRYPNGTIIRESLKMVGRMANIVANDIVFNQYDERLYKKDES